MLRADSKFKNRYFACSFGQPKGELWIYENFEQLQVPLSIQLGASFDFLAGTAKRAPVPDDKLRVAVSCSSDPKRLLPRYGKNLMFLTGLMVHEISHAWKRILKSLPKP
ncbi:MAG: WecB/TagA/CpsF family glycosyltransferase [Pirellulales bacterium]